MENLDSEFNCYRVRGLPVGNFGESYLIVSTVVEKTQRRWEWFFLSKRFDPGLLMSSYCYEESADFLDEHPIDRAYLLEEAKYDAYTQISDKLEELAEEKAKPQLLELKYDFLPIEANPIHNLWFHGLLHDDIKRMEESTQCEKLKRYLSLLVKSSFVRHARQ